MHVTRTVRGEVIPQRIEILAAAFRKAFQRPLQAGQDFQVFSTWFDGWIDQRLRFQVELARFPQEAKGEAGHDAESVLTIDAAPREGHGNGLLHAVVFLKIRKVHRRFEHGGGGLFCLGGFEAQRKRRQRQLFIPELGHHTNRLARENMFGQYKPHFDARSEEHTSELQSPCNLVCRLLLEKKKKKKHGILLHVLENLPEMKL